MPSRLVWVLLIRHQLSILLCSPPYTQVIFVLDLTRPPYTNCVTKGPFENGFEETDATDGLLCVTLSLSLSLSLSLAIQPNEYHKLTTWWPREKVASLNRLPNLSYCQSVLLWRKQTKLLLLFCKGESKVSQYFRNVSHNSTAFAEVVKTTNHTGPWAADLTWYSVSASHQICFSDLENNFKIHASCSTWHCQNIKVLATRTKFLKLSSYSRVMKFTGSLAQLVECSPVIRQIWVQS